MSKKVWHGSEDLGSCVGSVRPRGLEPADTSSSGAQMVTGGAQGDSPAYQCGAAHPGDGNSDDAKLSGAVLIIVSPWRFEGLHGPHTKKAL